MSPENLSRRAILAGAASVPALALPAVIAVAAPTALPAAVVAALPAAPDHPVIALAERAIEAWEAHGAAIDVFEPFDEAMFKWRDKNLRPAKRTLEGRDVSSSTSGLNEMERGLIGIMRRPPADYEEQDRDYRAAVAKWERREKAAKLRTGFTEAEAKTVAACHASWDAMRARSDTVPQTFAGLAAKARAARHLKDDIADELISSLARDIGVLAGEIDREAVQS